MQRKRENLEDTVKRCRTEIASLKRENKNLVKREVSEHREKGKTSSKSSLTLAETPSIVSTVNINSKSLLDTSWPKSPINNNSRQLVPCSKDSSPHTPSGPPPATPLTAPHSSKSLETPLYKKSNLEVIKQVGNKYDFENLLESIKNAEVPSGDEQENDYSSMDIDSYPDYYWQMGYESDDGKYFELSE